MCTMPFESHAYHANYFSIINMSKYSIIFKITLIIGLDSSKGLCKLNNFYAK